MTQVFGLTHNATLTAPAYSVDLGNEVVRLGSIQGLAYRAGVGGAATSGITIDDPTGTLDIPAWYYFVVRETALPAGNDTIWHGQTVVRTVSRGRYIAGAGREWSVDLLDDNAYLDARLVLVGADRPEETASARLTWLLGTSYCPVSDLGMVDYDTGTTMSANDYDGQFYKDVLADIAIATGYNFWVEYIQSSGLLSLHMYDPDSTRYTSLARISNVYSDYASGSNTFAGQNAKLTLDPTRVFSGTRVEYNGGAVRRTSGATSSNFAIRDGIAPMGNVSTLAAATALADKFLADNDTEDERVDVTIRVPRAQARDIRPGHRVYCKFSHLPGWTDWRYARVVEHAIAQIAPDETYYTMPLKLIPVSTPVQVSVVQWAEASAGLNAPYEVVLDAAPTEGNMMIALWYPRTTDTAPTSIEGVTAWSLDVNGDAYDATQYGGPGNTAYLYAYSRTAGAGESASVTVTPGILQSSCIIVELSGVSSYSVQTNEATVNPGGSLSITDASIVDGGMLLVGWTMQRTTYADPDSVTGSGGVVELYDQYDTINFAPHRWLAYANSSGGSVTVTGSPAANAELNKWAVYAVGYSLE